MFPQHSNIMKASHQFCVILLLITHYSFAQNTRTIDSLQQLIHKTHHDQDKVTIYNLLAEEYIYVDSVKVAHYTSQAIRLSKTIGYSEGLADAWYYLGFVTMIKEYHVVAQKYFMKSLHYAQKANFKKGVGKAYNGLGLIYWFKQQWDKSLAYHHKALRLRTQIGDQGGTASSSHNIALIHHYRGDYSKALVFYERSLRLERALANQKGMANTYNSIGNVQRTLGKLNQAQTAYLQSLQIRVRIKDKKGLVGSYTNLGTNYYQQGNYSQALALYGKALAMSREIGDHRSLASIYNNIGIIHKIQGQYPKALEFYQKSLKLKQEMGDLKKTSNTLNSIGLVYKDQGNYAKAREFCQRGLQKAKQIKYKRGIADNTNNLGAIYLQQGLYAKASQYYQQALKLYEQMKNKSSLSHCYLGLGRIALLQKQYQKANALFMKALKIRETTGQKTLSAEAQVNLGIAFFAVEDYTQAQHYLEKGVTTASKIGVPVIVRDGSQYLTKLYQALGNPQKALENHLRFKKMADSLLNKETIQKIARLETQYIAKKREDSLGQVQDQKEQLMQADLRQRETTQRATYLGLILSVLLILALTLFYCIQQRSNRKLNHTNAALEDALQQLKELDHFKERMVGMVVHDLKNPLQAIIGFSSDQPHHPYLSAIHQAAQRMHLLILNMLDTQKSTQAAISLDKSRQSLPHLGQSAIEQVQWFAQAKNIHLRQQSTQAIHLSLDPGLIQRVLLNLLHNALKFTSPNGQITLQYEVPEDAKQIKVMVIDNGEGIASDHQAVIFEPYEQAKAHQGSTGLGLAFCKMVIEAHQGNIGVDSVPGQGSTFWFTLPRCEASLLESLPHHQVVDTGTTTVQLTPEDRAYLQPYLSEMKACKFYQLTKINAILNQMEVAHHSPLDLWKTTLQEAVVMSNQAQYEALISV